MLRFLDGFDSYVTADITKKWSSIGIGTPVISAGTGRRGTASLRCPNSATSGTVILTLDAQASWVIGAAFKASAFPATVRSLVALLDAGSVQCDLRLNTDGTLAVTRAGTALTNGTSVSALVTNTVYYLEWKVTIANSIGASTCQVRINGVDWITVATGQDTQATANATANQVRLGADANTTTTLTYDWDDLYICDGTGGAPHNTFLGDSRVDTLLPSADGTSQQWTPSTPGTHYTLVDEAAPNTTDYVSSATAGQRDTYGMQDLTAVTGTIYGVQLSLAALKSDAGARAIKPLLLSGASEALGTATALSTSQTYTKHVQTTDPATGVAWSEAGVNAAQAGAEIA